jgi:single-stranded DNA-binding protein
MNPADRVELIGRLGAAPEIKPVAAGRMLIINLAVQVVSFGTDENGERRSTEKTSWLRVTSFDPRIIARAQGLEKDDLIAVHGYRSNSALG